MNSLDKSRVPGFALVALMLVLWEATSRSGWVDANYLPPVTVVIRSLFDLIESFEIVRHTLITLRRVLLGYFLGASCGYILGFICGYFPRMHSILELSIEYLRPMPSVALIPIGILFLGMGDVLNIAIIGWACSWPVFINTMDGVRATDRVLINTARTFGLSGRTIIWKVIVPSSLPFVFSGLRVGLGIALAVVVITEMAASGEGLGSFILNTSLSFRVPEMYAAIITVGLFGYLLGRAFLMVENRILGWQQGFLSAGK